MNAQYLTDPHRAPGLGVERLLVVVTGAVAASSTPGWLAWLRDNTPGMQLKVVMTRSAARFVTPTALAATSGGEVLVDEWSPEGHDAVHVQLAEWANAVVVFPATLHFMGRFALGLADTPVLLALQSTSVPVALAPAVPPGAVDGHAYREHWSRLSARPNVVLVPAAQGRSVTTRRVEPGSPAPLAEVLQRLEELRVNLAAPPSGARAQGANQAPDVVDAFGTGLLETTVRRARDGGFTWTRQPGPLAPSGFTRVPPVVERQAGEATAPARLCVGGSDPHRRDYAVAGRHSMATLLIEHGPDGDAAALLHGLGAALRRLHEAAPPAVDGAAPPTVARLDRWLDGRAAVPAAAAAGQLLRTTVDEPMWEVLRSWTAELVGCRDGVRVHGAPGLAALVPDRDRRTAALLTGEDLGTGPRELDLGFVLGELIEMRWRCGGDGGAWQALVDALGEGYGAELGPRVHRVAALRVALHLHDYTAYVRWDAEEIKRYGSFLGFLTTLSRGSDR